MNDFCRAQTIRHKARLLCIRGIGDLNACSSHKSIPGFDSNEKYLSSTDWKNSSFIVPEENIFCKKK